jgi:hypothetical protein
MLLVGSLVLLISANTLIERVAVIFARLTGALGLRV